METITTTKTDKAILIDSRLLVSPLTNSIHNNLLENHDIFYIDIDPKLTPKKQAKAINNSVFRLFQKNYKYFTFVGYKESCEIGIELHRQKGLLFQSYVFVDPKVSDGNIVDLINEEVKILSLEKSDKSNFCLLTKNFFKQEYKTKIPLSYYQRASQEMMGWLTYEVYNCNYLTDSSGVVSKLI